MLRVQIQILGNQNLFLFLYISAAMCVIAADELQEGCIMPHTVTGFTPTQLPQCIREVTAEWPLSIGMRRGFYLQVNQCYTVGHKIFLV